MSEKEDMGEIEKTFPPCFPAGFREKLMGLGAKEQQLVVYHICKYGVIDDDAFLGTWEETQRGLRISRKKLDPQDVGSYSTSCHILPKDSRRILRTTLRNPPKAIVTKGIIQPHKGLSQVTAERDNKVRDSHVDWWIYLNACVYCDFQEVNIDEECK